MLVFYIDRKLYINKVTGGVMSILMGQKFRKLEEARALLLDGHAVVIIRISSEMLMAYGDSHDISHCAGCYCLSCNWTGAGNIHSKDNRVVLCKGELNPPCLHSAIRKCEATDLNPRKCFA